MLDINLPGPTKSPNHSTSNLSHPRDGHINRTPADQFLNRHIGPNDAEIQQMLSAIGYNSIESLIDNTIPQGIRLNRPLNLPTPLPNIRL
ncbi:Glycine cleavage system P-protein [Limnospira platensis C1]|nr:Glycine cleavage system P-protein [Arthrospira platensis C1]